MLFYMKLKVIGSSGATPFPKPGCYCMHCIKAIKEGIPYERICSSLFVFPDILIDTPEEVSRRLSHFGIAELKHVFYTHWHPDHTAGSRIFGLWTRAGIIGDKAKAPIKVYLPDDMVADFDEHLKGFRFYEQRKYLEFVTLEDRTPVKIGELTITPVSLKRLDRIRYAFLLEQDGKKVMYAPCSVFDSKLDEFWQDLDVLFLETGWQGPTKEYREKKVKFWFKDHISLEENFEWLEKLKPKQMILTHIPGELHQTYDMMKEATKEYKDVEVAFDGMDVSL